MKQFKELREMSTRFVFDNLQTATKAEKLAKRFKLETDAEKSMGNYFLAVTGKYTDIMKWMKQLEMKGIGVSESRKLAEAKKQIDVPWDFGNPQRLAPDWQDEKRVVMLNWDKRKGVITLGGEEKNLINWLVKDYDMDKKDAMLIVKKGKMFKEGRYTSDDGGAFDGLRIAQYLSDQDGNPRWSRVSYGDSEDYLNQAMTMLKKDPRKARDILSKPTPRSGSL